MKSELIITADGSHSIAIPEMNVTYHSIHGAIQESMHVFINAGFRSGRLQLAEQYKIFEVGFGTGLNALLTLIESEKAGVRVFYEAIELHPILMQQSKELNYCDQLAFPELQPLFEKLHSCEWDKEIPFTANFTLLKRKEDLSIFRVPGLFNLIYFDAFAPSTQPELWTKEIFDKMYEILEPGGILVTYCSKGDVRRAMIAAGFKVEKLPGPRHKREMIRAKKR